MENGENHENGKTTNIRTRKGSTLTKRINLK